ncbi:Mor transcription activator domain protein [Pseudogulbenkiania sp. NH8B]|uniref:Mor transcription activator family protein n=1 Tax=Pseudogulbenkiania sp. (strain NH8B) TaxID=748280 RepID=UPI0002279B42|nr:Mor transcription activator family protein [Pseudogulbenkiania sp. NH8B]BAK76471.1 Mor transcription activator domain protein [Pseudogulbenkiania sp. NH8B]BAK76900.1 Mor transcription activator domain protein [Pseudogulbenkiania sp. NH8B]
MGKMNEEAIARAQHLLPENARELVRLIGLNLTMKLVDLLGGTHFPIPKTAKQEGQYFAALAEVVGVEAAKVLIRQYGNTRLYVPKCAAALRALRDANIRADYDRHCRELGHNATVNHILVPKYRLCDRRLEKILSKVDELLPEAAAQGQLF